MANVETLYSSKDLSYKPLFLLNSNKNESTMCYCAECEKVSTLEFLADERNNLANSVRKAECSDCGNKGLVKFIKPTLHEEGWEYHIPAYVTDVAVTKHSENGVTQKINTNVTINNVNITADGNVTSKKTNIVEVIDLEKRTHQVYETYYNSDGKEDVQKRKALHVLDCYKYRSKSHIMGIERVNSTVKGQLTNLAKRENDPIIAFGGYFGGTHAFDSEMSYASDHKLYKIPNVPIPVLPTAIENKSNSLLKMQTDDSARDELNRLNAAKRYAILSHMAENGRMPSVSDKNLHVYTDFMINKVCLTEHKLKSDESNTNIDPDRAIRFMNMLIRYPAAFELACNMADHEITNEAFNRLRKEKGDEFSTLSDDEKKAAVEAMLTPKTMQKTSKNPDGTTYTENVFDSEFPSSAKAVIFRNKIEYMEVQLAMIDDSILDTINKSKNKDEMIEYLRYYVGGPQTDTTVAAFKGETKTPPHITATMKHNHPNIEEENLKPTNEAISTTKKVIAHFNRNPIGTANTIRQFVKHTPLSKSAKGNEVATYKKAIATLLDETVAKSKAINYNYINSMRAMGGHDDINGLIQGDTVTAIRDGDYVSFMKRLSETRTPMDMIEVHTNTDKGLLTDTVNMYAELIHSKNVKLLTSKENVERDVDVQNKHLLRNYLVNNSIESAYVDFIFIRGDNMANPTHKKYSFETKAYVDKLANEIIEDSKLNAIANFHAEHGAVAIVNKIKENEPEFAEYMSILKKTDIFKKYEAEAGDSYEQSLAKIIDLHMEDHVERINREEYVTGLGARNGESLFDRSISGIHDELSHLTSKKMIPNTAIKYSEETLKLEAEYDCPDSDNPNHKWGFHLMKESNDFVRTAQALSNCMAGSTYINAGINGSRTFLYMTDELGQRVAAIELYPNGKDEETGANKYRCNQFQSHHDTALPERYANVALRWMDEHNIDYRNCSDVKKFGQNVAIYGDGTTNFNHLGVNEVTGDVITLEQAESIAKKTKEHAKLVYGVDDDGNAKIPAADEKLKNTDYGSLTKLKVVKKKYASGVAAQNNEETINHNVNNNDFTVAETDRDFPF